MRIANILIPLTFVASAAATISKTGMAHELDMFTPCPIQ
jgi:hypothetical protein